MKPKTSLKKMQAICDDVIEERLKSALTGSVRAMPNAPPNTVHDFGVVARMCKLFNDVSDARDGDGANWLTHFGNACASVVALATGEHDPQLRAALVALASLCVEWIEDIDRRGAR